jgi:hypothetical protein
MVDVESPASAQGNSPRIPGRKISMPEPSLFRIVYVSTSVPPFTEAGLVTLLARTRPTNEAADVTGMLLYKDGNWLQVLEGPTQAVRDMFRKIRADRRHQDVTPVIEEPITGRLFDQWSMGFRNLSARDFDTIPGFTDFMSRGYTRHGFKPDPSGCLDILRLFRDG